MIPKVINYCWFGNGKKNEIFYKCIASWKKFLPDYQIKEWNESNFDVNKCEYTKEAYSIGKYAFVSDYARLKIIYENGGIYFDTDVEILKNMDYIIEKGAFIGCELEDSIATGLGFGAEPKNEMVKEMLDEYNGKHFIENGKINSTPCPIYNTQPFIKSGWNKIENNKVVKVKDIWVYPPEFFSPFNYLTGEVKITQNTYTYHYGDASWLPEYEKKLFDKKKILVKKYGKKFGKILYYIEKFFILLMKDPKKLIRRVKK